LDGSCGHLGVNGKQLGDGLRPPPAETAFRRNREILDPLFKPTDQILLTGNYGLPDTAKVSIQKP
jgi:hypothetical protein